MEPILETDAGADCRETHSCSACCNHANVTMVKFDFFHKAKESHLGRLVCIEFEKGPSKTCACTDLLAFSSEEEFLCFDWRSLEPKASIFYVSSRNEFRPPALLQLELSSEVSLHVPLMFQSPVLPPPQQSCKDHENRFSQ